MKRIPKVWRVTVILGVLALVAAACGGDDPAPAPAPAPAPVIVEVPVPQPAPDPVIIEVPVPAEAPAPVVIEVPVEAPAPAGPPQVQDMALTTVNINGGPFYAFNLWAAAAALGIADELDIELNVSSQGFFPTAALKRGEFDVIASCPPCAFGVYESIPEFRNWITSYQWRGVPARRQGSRRSPGPQGLERLLRGERRERRGNKRSVCRVAGRPQFCHLGGLQPFRR